VTEENPILGRGYSLNEYRINASVRDQIDRVDLMEPRSDDGTEFADALELRARIIDAGDRKTARMLRDAADEYRRLVSTVERMSLELTRARTLIAACVTAVKGDA
jgi:hypothetical protein